MKKDSLYAALAAVQGALKCTKGQYNSFGEFKYRSAEDILEAVKPLLTKYGLYLRLSDEVLLVGDRYYIRATATAIETATGAQERLGACPGAGGEEKVRRVAGHGDGVIVCTQVRAWRAVRD